MTVFESIPGIAVVLKDLALVVIPVVLAVLGNRYTQAIKEKETRAQFVALALEQLKLPPSPPYESLRRWSVEVINRYSGIPLSEGAKNDLISKVAFGGSLAEEIFTDVASIGTQLGLLNEVVLFLSDSSGIENESLHRLRSIVRAVEMKKMEAGKLNRGVREGG